MGFVDEAQLHEVTIGDLTPYATKVVIEEYDPVWPAWFEWDRARIAAALGPVALSIEHAGSTSVPGLPAKPIIDILLQVSDTTDEDAYLPPLVAAGYELRIREPEWLEHRLVRRRGKPHDANVHVFSRRHAAAEIDRMLTFRDWLRAHEDDRIRYAATKRDLSTREWRYVQDYADAKTEVVEEILARAYT